MDYLLMLRSLLRDITQRQWMNVQDDKPSDDLHRQDFLWY